MKRAMTPLTATTDEDLCSMPRSTVESGDFWILTDCLNVTIAEQKMGESPKQSVTVPRATFDRFVRWYVTGRLNGKIAPEPKEGE